MSAPKTSDPIAVMTKDGAAWLRRVVTGEGRGLYAVDGSCACPEYLMATLAELAEHGIAGMADALPMPVGPEPELAEDRERVELLAGFERALSPFCEDPKSAAAAVVGVRDPEVEWLLRDAQRLQDRVIELEALTPAPIQTCRVCGAGYTYGQPCSTCEFRARMAAEGYDASGASVEAGASRWSRFFAPTQAYREETQAAGVPCSKCGAPVHWVKSSNSDGGFWRHSYVPGRVLDHFGEVAESEGRHAFEKERLGESDAKRRLARCKHCGQDREAPMHAESGGGR